MSHAELALLHAASQLIYRWIPPLAPDPFRPSSNDVNLHQMNKSSWLDLLHQSFDFEGETIRWVKFYRKTFADRGEHLVKSLMRHLQMANDHGAAYVTWASQDYPALLRTIPDPPLALTFTGDCSILQKPLVAVVGSRKASPFAISKCLELGKYLAQSGYTIVSGGALGCDIMAHRGVLDTALNPVPAANVFAGGLIDLYPHGNFQIFEKLKRRGAVCISERLWWQEAKALDFIMRNRIISGLSETVFIMQAHLRSGAMLTANFALDQGRDLQILIHPQADIRAEGSHKLLGDGASGFLEIPQISCEKTANASLGVGV
jgi:DNA processing protein